MTHLAQIWRFPIKGVGSEPLECVGLHADAPLPGDRAWAVLHEGAADHDEWQPRRNFTVVAYGPKLAQVAARTEADGRITLRHPDRPELTLDPEVEGPALVDWLGPLWPEAHSRAHRLVKAPAKSMADNGLAQVSLHGLSSLKALSQRAGVELSPLRFRGNLWLDGLAPWEEFDLVGKRIRIGEVELEVTERIDRCRATEANPETGLRDVDTMGLLREAFDHKDFGVYASVRTSGSIAVGDPFEVIG